MQVKNYTQSKQYFASIENMNDLPKTVYKYRKWTDEHKTIITDQIGYFSPPDKFPDTSDCFNPVRYDLLTPPMVRAVYTHYYKLDTKRVVEDLETYIDYWVSRNRFNPGRLDYLRKQEKEEFSKLFGVLSLAEYPDNEYLWKIYSDNQTGFCVSFDSKKLFSGTNAGGGGPVIYEDELPHVWPEPFHTYEVQNFLQIFFKRKVNGDENYHQEREYRLFKYFKFDSPHPLFESIPAMHSLPSTLNRGIKIPKEAYEEIIIGKSMGKSERNEIKSLINLHLPGVKVIEI